MLDAIIITACAGITGIGLGFLAGGIAIMRLERKTRARLMENTYTSKQVYAAYLKGIERGKQLDGEKYGCKRE
jgi:hypothetical protein